MRDKTNSITHLVKIVAKEVFYEEWDKRATNLTVQKNIFEDTVRDLGHEYLGKIQTSLEKAGRVWPREEDALLEQEVRTALAQIAKNHSRSIVAIRSRIDQKELI